MDASAFHSRASCPVTILLTRAKGEFQHSRTIVQDHRSANLECETLRGFHASAAGVTPAPSDNRKMARPPFCSQVLFPLASFLCHPESEAKNLRSSLITPCTHSRPATAD